MRTQFEIQEKMEECLNLASECIAGGCACDNGLRALSMFSNLAWVLEWDPSFQMKEIRDSIDHYLAVLEEETEDAKREGS